VGSRAGLDGCGKFAGNDNSYDNIDHSYSRRFCDGRDDKRTLLKGRAFGVVNIGLYLPRNRSGLSSC
jgi:hypothetical protein